MSVSSLVVELLRIFIYRRFNPHSGLSLWLFWQKLHLDIWQGFESVSSWDFLECSQRIPLYNSLTFRSYQTLRVGKEYCHCNQVSRGNHFISGQHFKHELIGYKLETRGILNYVFHWKCVSFFIIQYWWIIPSWKIKIQRKIWIYNWSSKCIVTTLNVIWISPERTSCFAQMKVYYPKIL